MTTTQKRLTLTVLAALVLIGLGSTSSGQEMLAPTTGGGSEPRSWGNELFHVDVDSGCELEREMSGRVYESRTSYWSWFSSYRILDGVRTDDHTYVDVTLPDGKDGSSKVVRFGYDRTATSQLRERYGRQQTYAQESVRVIWFGESFVPEQLEESDPYEVVHAVTQIVTEDSGDDSTDPDAGPTWEWLPSADPFDPLGSDEPLSGPETEDPAVQTETVIRVYGQYPTFYVPFRHRSVSEITAADVEMQDELSVEDMMEAFADTFTGESDDRITEADIGKKFIIATHGFMDGSFLEDLAATAVASLSAADRSARVDGSVSIRADLHVKGDARVVLPGAEDNQYIKMVQDAQSNCWDVRIWDCTPEERVKDEDPFSETYGEIISVVHETGWTGLLDLTVEGELVADAGGCNGSLDAHYGEIRQKGAHPYDKENLDTMRWRRDQHIRFVSRTGVVFYDEEGQVLDERIREYERYEDYTIILKLYYRVYEDGPKPDGWVKFAARQAFNYYWSDFFGPLTYIPGVDELRDETFEAIWDFTGPLREMFGLGDDDGGGKSFSLTYVDTVPVLKVALDAETVTIFERQYQPTGPVVEEYHPEMSFIPVFPR